MSNDQPAPPGIPLLRPEMVPAAAHWTIREATSWLIFRNPDRALPRLDKSIEEEALRLYCAQIEGDDYVLRYDSPPYAAEVYRLASAADGSDEFLHGLIDVMQKKRALRSLRQVAEDILVREISARGVASGIPQYSEDGRKQPTRSRRRIITPEDLVGHVTLNSPLDEPSKSFLHCRNEDPVEIRSFRDVRICAASLKKAYKFLDLGQAQALLPEMEPNGQPTSRELLQQQLVELHDTKQMDIFKTRRKLLHQRLLRLNGIGNGDQGASRSNFERALKGALAIIRARTPFGPLGLISE